MKITIQLGSPIKVQRDESDVSISKTIAAVERENGPSKFAVASMRTKKKLASSLRNLAKQLAAEEDA